MAVEALAVVGLGGMGEGIARRLLDTGFTVAVHNRTREKALPLAEAGARVADSPAAAVAGADAVVLSLADEAAVEEVLFGSVLDHLEPGTTVVDTSTVSMAYARDAAGRLAAAGVRRVEACLVGNPHMAREGNLRVFTGGEPDAVEAVSELLEAIGGLELRYLGRAGMASALKLSFNLLLGAQTVALAEAVAFGTAAGLDRDTLLAAVAGSGFSSPVLSFRAQFMRRREYRPAAFRAALMEKDLRLVADDAAGHGLTLPLTTCAADRFADAVRAGDADADAAVVVEAAGGRPISEPDEREPAT